MKTKILKLNKLIFTYSLLVALIGVFLLPNTAYFSNITENNIIDLTNKERISNDLPPLKQNQLLSEAAYAKGKSILENQLFSHTINNKKFSAWIRETGYEYLYSGENLAIDFMTSEGAIKAWMNSESHRNNILNENFKEIGIGIVEGKFNGQNSIIIVQIFGTPIAQTVNKKITPTLNIYNNYTIDSSISTNQINNDAFLNRSNTGIKVYAADEKNDPLKILSKNSLIFSIMIISLIFVGFLESIKSIIYMLPYKKYKIKRKNAKIKR